MLAMTASTGAYAQQVEAVIGCYAVTVGAWSGPARHGVRTPATIRLFPTPAEGILGRAGRAMEPVVLRSRDGGEAYWTIDNRAIRLVWTTGYVVIVATVEVQEDRLVGFVEAGTDERGAPDPRAPFEARRIECAD
jgi:hypothetical protein